MEVSGQLHASIALPPVPIELGGPPRAGLDLMEKRDILTLPGLEPRPFGPYPVYIPTELSKLLILHPLRTLIRSMYMKILYEEIKSKLICDKILQPFLSISRSLLLAPVTVCIVQKWPISTAVSLLGSHFMLEAR
jgi:hypothetical protein